MLKAEGEAGRSPSPPKEGEPHTGLNASIRIPPDLGRDLITNERRKLGQRCGGS